MCSGPPLPRSRWSRRTAAALAAAVALPAAALALGVVLPARDVRAEEAATEPPPAKPLDFDFYRERVSPIVHRICTECHADPRKRLGRHFLRPVHGRAPRPADHRRNFETLSALIVPGNPAKSLWLLKPLGPGQGGVAHKGGERIRFDGLEYATMVEFINGARLPQPAREPVGSDATRRAPEVGRAGLTVQAEDFEREGDASAVLADGAEGLVVLARKGTVTLRTSVRAPEDRAYEILFRALRAEGAASPASFAVRVDGASPQVVEVVAAGFSDVGPRTPCDGDEPLDARAGDLRVEGESLRMRGTAAAPARWLERWEGEHAAVEASVELPAEDEGGDDALLLFDAADAENGKYVGLTDGGRRFVLGVMEGGRPRALSSAEAPPAPEDARERRIRVEYVDGVAVGRLDGKPLVHANLDDALGRDGRFGFLAHGTLLVKGVAASGQYDLHRVRFRERPMVALGAGLHVVTVELGPDGPALDAMVLRESPQ